MTDLLEEREAMLASLPAHVKPAQASPLAEFLERWLGRRRHPDVMVDEFPLIVEVLFSRLAEFVEKADQPLVLTDLQHWMSGLRMEFGRWRFCLDEEPDAIEEAWRTLRNRTYGFVALLEDLWVELPAVRIDRGNDLAPNPEQERRRLGNDLAMQSGDTTDITGFPEAIRCLHVSLDPPLIRCGSDERPITSVRQALKALQFLRQEAGTSYRFESLEKTLALDIGEDAFKNQMYRLKLKLKSMGEMFDVIANHLYSNNNRWALWRTLKERGLQCVN